MTKSHALALASLLSAACDRSILPATPSAASSPTTSAIAATPPPPVASAAASTSAVAPSASTATSADVKVTFDDDVVGAPPREFEAVVGSWNVVDEGGARGLKVDGSKWQSGTPSPNLIDQAERLFGNRSAEFVDGVKAFASFPFAIWTHEPPKGDVAISVRFYPEGGKIDQGAGIAFDIGADGSYWGVRANALEDNLLFFRVVKGRRTVLDDVRKVPTPSKTWHTLALEIRAKQLVAKVDGRNRFERTLEAAPKGRVGLWSKAHSQVLFDDFTLTPLSMATP